MEYENDTRRTTMEEIERIITNRYGNDSYSRECGGYLNGSWLSINSILELISDRI